MTLPRLQRTVALTDSTGGPSFQLQRDWDEVIRAIEAIEARTAALETAVATIQARLAAAGIP